VNEKRKSRYGRLRRELTAANEKRYNCGATFEEAKKKIQGEKWDGGFEYRERGGSRDGEIEGVLSAFSTGNVSEKGVRKGRYLKKKTPAKVEVHTHESAKPCRP